MTPVAGKQVPVQFEQVSANVVFIRKGGWREGAGNQINRSQNTTDIVPHNCVLLLLGGAQEKGSRNEA